MILFCVAHQYSDGEQGLIFSTLDLAVEYAKAHKADYVYRVKVDDPDWQDPDDIGWTSERVAARR